MTLVKADWMSFFMSMGNDMASSLVNRVTIPSLVHVLLPCTLAQNWEDTAVNVLTMFGSFAKLSKLASSSAKSAVDHDIAIATAEDSGCLCKGRQ